MRLKQHILFVLLLVGFMINTTEAQISYNSPTTQQVSTISHTVKMGETTYSIANAYNTTVDEIYRLNPNSRDKINVGQLLRVPNNTKTEPQAKGYQGAISHQHIILAKETLFSVSKQYNISVAELLKANPGLSETTFSIGREINIPDFSGLRVASVPVEENKYIEHIVAKQETLYNISRTYDCTITDILNINPVVKEMGLQEGTIVYIPKKANSQLQPIDINTNYSTFHLPQDGIARVALLLPFIQGSKIISQERITEYYEGFLLAVHKLKEQGLNAEIYTFDIGSDSDTRRLESILGTSELNSLNLIVGGVSDKQVQLISQFSKNTGVKYVVPFSNKNTGVEHNKNMYQVGNSHTSLFAKVAQGFAKEFANSNIIFLSEPGSDKNKADFVKELQAGLKAANVPFRIAPSSASITDNIGSVINQSKQNIVIPSSSSETTLRKLLAAMPMLTKKDANISLFGYPEWQAYVNHTKTLHEYNTYMYSMFYLDTLHPEAQLFADKYKRWYNKNFLVTLPRYAHMGYDTGMVFLTALRNQGHNFSYNINVPTLQSALSFEPTSINGGYINTGIYIIELGADGSVTKTLIGK